FGLGSEEEGESMRVELGGLDPLDERGAARVELLVDRLPATTGLLEAEVRLRDGEAGGRAVERRLALPVRPAMTVIGIAPNFADDTVPENTRATFRMVAMSPDGSRVALDG